MLYELHSSILILPFEVNSATFPEKGTKNTYR